MGHMQSAHELAFALRTAYLSMHRQTSAFLLPFRITADQFVLLCVLAQRDGITQQEISTRAASDPNTVRAMLVLMQKKELVARTPHQTDRRALAVTLTKKGRMLYAEIFKQIQPLHDVLQAPFLPEDTQALISYLDRISEAMTSRSGQADRQNSVSERKLHKRCQV